MEQEQTPQIAVVALQKELKKLIYLPGNWTNPDRPLALVGNCLGRKLAHRDVESLSLDETDQAISFLKAHQPRDATEVAMREVIREYTTTNRN